MDAFFDSIDRHFVLVMYLGVAVFFGLRCLIHAARGGDDE